MRVLLRSRVPFLFSLLWVRSACPGPAPPRSLSPFLSLDCLTVLPFSPLARSPAMDADVFRVRIAPLLSADALRALRAVNRDWQWVVDQLIEVKGAFGLRRWDRLTVPDVRYARSAKPPAMDASVFRVRIAPLLSADDLRALRRVNHAWQWVVDQLIEVKGAFVLRRWDKLTVPDVRYARSARLMKLIDGNRAQLACAGGELDDLQWALTTFPVYLPAADLAPRVTRIECMQLLIRDYKLQPRKALQAACESGSLAVAEWLVQTFNFTAGDARSGDSSVLRGACTNGHLAVAEWLVQTFSLKAHDARSSCAFYHSCANGHLAVAKWLVQTFGLPADDTHTSSAFNDTCTSGHLAVGKWMLETFGFSAVRNWVPTGDALRRIRRRGHVQVAGWLRETFGVADD
jgi:hypothetical protein